MMTSLRSKWAAGKAVRAGLAVGGRISKSIRNRRATQPAAYFQRNPPGRVQLAVFPRCSLDPESGALVRLFHPRQDQWDEHFERNGVIIVGRTAIGRATVGLLKMNAADRRRIREL
jgi:hypothetical protein